MNKQYIIGILFILLIIIVILSDCKTPTYNNTSSSVLQLYTDTITKVQWDSIMQYEHFNILNEHRLLLKDYESKKYTQYYLYTKDSIVYRLIPHHDSLIVTKRILK